MNNNDVLIRLIQDLRQNSQDDTDPSNVVLQQFHSPYEENTVTEATTIKKWNWCPTWFGIAVAPSFNWNQGGYYAQSMEVMKCLMLI